MTRSDIDQSIGERFDAVAQMFPDRVAVRQGGRVTSYGELHSSARSVAAHLTRRLGEKPRPIALMSEPGAALFAAMLGTLRSGHFYVPLDPALPASRLQAICRDLEPGAIVADRSWLGRARSLVADGVPVWTTEEVVAASDPAEPPVSVSPDDLAYVLFTSGSTGAPKGVMQSHRNVLHNTMKLASGLQIRGDDRLTLLSSPSFGASVSDIFGALLMGASVSPYSLAGDRLRHLPEFLTREAITIYHSVPSVFRCFAWTLDGREDFSALRIVRLGGEAVLASDFDLYRNRFPRSCRFHAGLGATEINVIRQWSASHDTTWPGGSPLGYAVDGTEVVLLEEDGRAAAREGEIAVIAPTLATGYWNDAARTAAAFVEVPGRPDVRLYRTGDLGRMLPDGCLLYAGRRGAGVKIRGHRVATDAVEAALLAIPGVREAAVEGRDEGSGTRLIAWIVRRPEDPPGIRILRTALSERLPGYMVPSSFVFLDHLPRTASGKLDRPALPHPGATRPPLDSVYREARDEAEAAVARIVAGVLGLERVGVEDDFFELGGDSLSAVKVLTLLSERFGTELSVADLLKAPTPVGLAIRARRSGLAEPAGLVRIQPGKGRPVFVAPGGAGDGEDLFAARRLARLTGAGFPFYCFRSGAAPHPPLPELAARCVRQLRTEVPHGPYALVGDCVGGVLAIAIARRLRQEGEEVALLALLDTPFPGMGSHLHARFRLRAPRADRAVRRLRYFSKRLRYHWNVLMALREGRVRYALRMVRTGIRGTAGPTGVRERDVLARRASYVASLVTARPEPFDGMIHVVESEEARRRGFGDAWSRLGSASEVVRVPGDHAGFILEQGELVAASLRRWLAAAE